MPLPPGTRLGPYDVLSLLGSGGMGEVYKARDPRLGRDIALKILPADRAADPDRLRRFEREARAIAALNHPNIVTIYSVEEADGVHFITMELVEGRTLGALIPKNGLPMKAFFEIAIPLADALSAAHGQGIVHRDLKPDNLIVGKDGRLKVLDFGLATLREDFQTSTLTEASTCTLTAEGRIVGTVAYMSPEQAEGKALDHRSDLFSLGIVLHEMAAGERPFQGETTASIFSSILRDTPKLVSDVNPRLPRDLGRIVRHCLVKDPEYRYQAAKDVRNELAELQRAVESGEVQEPASVPSRRRSWLLPVALAVAVGAAATMISLLLNRDTQRGTSELLRHATFARLTSQGDAELDPGLAPDGTFFVYAGDSHGNLDIYYQRVGGEKAINLTEASTADDRTPALSPDGERVAFRSDREGGGIFLMGATGEAVRRLTGFGYNPAWSPDGREIAFATGETVWSWARSGPSQIWVVSVDSGQTRLLTEQDAMQPAWSPGGGRIAFCAPGPQGLSRIYTMPAAGGELMPVPGDAATDVRPAWSPDGRYLYFSSNRRGSMNLWRVRIDEASGRLLGEPEPITSGGASERHSVSFSRDGTRLVYVEDETSSNLAKVRFDRARGEIAGQPVPITRGPSEKYLPDASPDGNWVAFLLDFPRRDIAVVRQDGTELRRLTNDPHLDGYPRWSPDGKKIAFHSDRSGSREVWTIQPGGVGLVQLTNTPGQAAAQFPTWSPRDSRMAYVDSTQRISYIFNTDVPWAQQRPDPLPAFGPGDEGFWAFSWSPDGRWLGGFVRGAGEWAPHGVAVYSLESGEYRTLTDHGGYPCWLSDSRRLLYWHADAIHIVDSQTRATREVLRPAPGGARQGVSLSRDNAWLYYSHWTRAADIWMLTFEGAR